MQTLKASKGMKIYHRFRTDFETGEHIQPGKVVNIESGCNGGVIVRFDHRDYDIALPANDLVTIVNNQTFLIER